MIYIFIMIFFYRFCYENHFNLVVMIHNHVLLNDFYVQSEEYHRIVKMDEELFYNVKISGLTFFYLYILIFI
jgi:hypothetical protein